MLQIRVIATTFLLIGVMFLNGGVRLIKDVRADKRLCTARTKARVLRFTYWGEEETPYTLYVPWYEYRDEKGEHFIIEGLVHRHHHHMEHGDEVDFFYDPDAPEDHYYVPCERPMETPLLIFAFGLLTTAACVVGLLYSLTELLL